MSIFFVVLLKQMVIYNSKLNIYFKSQALKMNILIQTHYFIDEH